MERVIGDEVRDMGAGEVKVSHFKAFGFMLR